MARANAAPGRIVADQPLYSRSLHACGSSLSAVKNGRDDGTTRSLKASRGFLAPAQDVPSFRERLPETAEMYVLGCGKGCTDSMQSNHSLQPGAGR